MGEARPTVQVPSPDLLAAATLADDLMGPDGAVQTALVARYEQLDEDAFARDAASHSHVAANLLLIAATLRPMVLAPSSGAVSVADYLHLDGQYVALYTLVNRLREISAKLVGFRIDPTVLRHARGEAATRAELELLQRTAQDWLTTQAPAFTIRYAPATAVWKQWLRPEGLIEALVSPVIHMRLIASAQAIGQVFGSPRRTPSSPAAACDPMPEQDCGARNQPMRQDQNLRGCHWHGPWRPQFESIGACDQLFDPSWQWAQNVQVGAKPTVIRPEHVANLKRVARKLLSDYRVDCTKFPHTQPNENRSLHDALRSRKIKI